MAISVNYSHAADPKLGRIKIGNSVYWLKDQDLRDIVEAFGTAVEKDSTTAVTSEGAALPTESAVYDFVLSQIGNLGKVVNLRSEASHTGELDPVAAAGDMIVEADGSEWLYDGTAWREVGSEGAYVLKTTQVAGLSISDGITTSALSTALDLKAFAHASQGEVSLTDYTTGLEGADYTPAGSVEVVLSQTSTSATLTTGDYTPVGDVEVVLSQTATNASLSTADYTPAGTVSVTPSTASFYEISSVGTAPSVNESSASFATAGIVASIGTGNDADMLIFTDASTSDALTTTNFDAGTVPTLKESATSFVTGISSAAFTGSEAKDILVTNVAYDKATVSSASFSGTTAANVLVTSVAYDKATVSSAAFTGSSTTITPTLTSSTTTFTVSPKSE